MARPARFCNFGAPKLIFWLPGSQPIPKLPALASLPITSSQNAPSSSLRFPTTGCSQLGIKTTANGWGCRVMQALPGDNGPDQGQALAAADSWRADGTQREPEMRVGVWVGAIRCFSAPQPRSAALPRHLRCHSERKHLNLSSPGPPTYPLLRS